MHIDAVTGQKRTRSEFLERMYDGATALGAGRNIGGQGFTSNDMIGIMSDNCLVSVLGEDPGRGAETGIYRIIWSWCIPCL